MKKPFIKKASIISTLTMGTFLSTVIPANVLAESPIIAIQQEMNTSAEVLKLSFDENLSDSSTSKHSIAFKNGEPLFTDGRINNALQFKATSQKEASYIDLGNNEQFKFGENTNFTIAFWIKSSGVNADPAIISNKDWNSGGNLGWFVGLKDKSLLWNFKTSGSSRVDSTIPNVADNAWHHIVISHDRNSNATIYKDGKIAKQVDISKMKGTIDTNYTPKIGVDGKGSLFGNNFNMTLDDLSIFKKAVTTEEVQAMYEAAPPIPVTGLLVDQPSVQLKVGGFTYLHTEIKPLDATNKNVTWKSTNPNIAEVQMVDGKVKITGKATGKTTIQATSEDGKNTVQSEVTVTNSLDINQDGLLSNDDINMAKSLIGSTPANPNWNEIKKADLNEDNIINEIDIQILEKELNKHTTFPYKHVFIIGLDGAGVAVKNANAPHIQNFISNGASTYTAQALSPTMSGQNWAGILHGSVADKTKITNAIAESTLFPENSTVPSFMKMLKQERPNATLASFVGWNPINFGIIEQSAGAYLQSTHDNELTPKIVDYIHTKGKETDVTFIQLDDIDEAGHTYGHGSPEYVKQIERTDRNVNSILEAIRDADLIDDSLIIMTTDHGGKGFGHGGNSPEEKNIFWAINGPGINAPSTITAPMTNMDTAAVVAKALRLNQPATWDARTPENILATFPTNIKLNTSEHTLKEGESFELSSEINQNVSNKTLSWTSSNPSIATVETMNGKTTVHAKQAGTATITVTTATGEYMATCNVTVQPNYVPVTGIKVDERSFKLDQGNTKLLSASVLPENATNKKLNWQSSDSSIATLEHQNDRAYVKALKPGRVVLTASTEDKKYNKYIYIEVK
ncbi:Ig-like domain-containing protein [Bacillus mobilis]|uniref:Ig-like domain-containing protein n=1 Tax=Bacillus mobilis TaxID=2026190 RepID=UPI003CFD0468